MRAAALLVCCLRVVGTAGAGAGPAGAEAAGAAALPARDRVIVLGLDGVDPDVVQRLVAAGQLPNFARLRREAPSGASSRRRRC